MIAVDIQGGLGNQLFQYAVGRALALQTGYELVLDTRLVDSDRKRHFALEAYSIKGRFVDSSRLQPPGWLRHWAARFGLRTGSLQRYPFDAPLFEESDASGCWDDRVAALRAPVVLRGYFQSDRYFSGIAAELRTELVPLRTPSETFLSLTQAIRRAGPASTSLHVRRGDYASDPKTLAVHGLLGAEYYDPALSLLRSQVPAAHVFVFTDDPLAASTLLPADMHTTMVSGRGLTDVDELALMSTCCHQVIANSSYSWWGAWLGAPEGMTIAPRRWFAEPSEAAIRDRFPAHWHVVG